MPTFLREEIIRAELEALPQLEEETKVMTDLHSLNLEESKILKVDFNSKI